MRKGEREGSERLKPLHFILYKMTVFSSEVYNVRAIYKFRLFPIELQLLLLLINMIIKFNDYKIIL